MNLEPNTTVREVVLENPNAARVFEKSGIDYCCGGQRSLAEACASAGVAIDEVISSLELADSSPIAEEPNFLTFTVGKLIGHIILKHHVFTKDELLRLRELMSKVCSVHGENHPELGQLRELFGILTEELGPHMMKEERVLFPYVIAMEDALQNQRQIGTPPFGTVANPIRMMMQEHDNAGAILKEMRQLTKNYSVPPDACVSYQTLYQALDDLEKDLHQHIHLENNILFPKAVEMEG